MYLKNGLANETFNATTMHDIMDKADNFWAANQVESPQVAAITAAVTKVNQTQSTPKTDDAEVSAVGFRGRGNGRGFRGGRNRGRGAGGRGSQNQPQTDTTKPDPRGTRHSSNPPWNSCKAHWQFAEEAWQCQSPTTCPLKNKITPKNSQPKN